MRAADTDLRRLAGLFAISTALLTLEILQIKIFAFSLDPLRIYLAIGICLLGLGAGATALALVSQPSREAAHRWGARFALAAAVAVPLSHALFARLAAAHLHSDLAALVWQVGLTLPYFCIGITIALLLSARGAAIGAAYAVNLAGSGLGCILVFPLLDGLGAERLLMAVAALALASSLLLETPRTGAARGVTALVALGLAAGALPAASLLPFPPEPVGQLGVVRERVAELNREHPEETTRLRMLHSEWNRTARVDVFALETTIPELRSRVGEPLETLTFVQDASAGSILLGVGDDLARGRALFERTVYGAGYALGPREDVLVIGLGGAPDVLAALHHGASRIEAVEINGATIDLVADRFRDFLGDPYGRPEVRVHEMDGRTYLRSTDKRFDLIQMSGVDTKSIFAAGSLPVNENAVYTREAMGELLRRLRPDGVISINRFFDIDAHRLTSIAVAGLRDLGEPHPERHLFVLGQGVWRCVLVKREPFEPHEIERLHAWAAHQAGPGGAPAVVIPSYTWIGVRLDLPMRVMYSPEPRPVAVTPFFEALAAGRHEAFVARAERDLSAPVDDRPFFFFTDRTAQALRAPPTFLRTLYATVAQLTAVAAVFILAPLVVARRRGLASPGAGRALAYFACLGAGFMLVEIGLIQRFVLLLGHQSYSVSVVLFGLLLGASLGSLLSARLSLASRWPLVSALATVALAVVVYAFGLASLLEAAAAWSFGGRLALALVTLLLLGLPLGIPFPTALRALQAASGPNGSLVAWGIGVNGFASVVGSTLAVPLAVLFGLRVLLLLGAGLYALALLAAPVPVARSGAEAG